ncbi:MAG: hypothetical protein IKU26_08490 [Clostridia bacterium]|nr:hypothetical protein [Clostridia bacterium]
MTLERHLSKYDEIESAIGDAVRIIQDKIKTFDLSDGWACLKPNPEEYFRNKSVIKVSDNIVFPTNKDVCNIILGKNYKGNQNQMVSLEGNLSAWLPTKMDVNRPNCKGYSNLISEDGTKIYESTDDPEEREKRKSEQRVVFAQTTDPFTNRKGYRFIGVFEGVEYRKDGTLVHKRTEEEFKILM